MERIGEQVRGELARLLRDEVSDPRIGLVTLTRVEVAPDLSTASVFFSQLATGAQGESDAAVEDESLRDVENGLRSASGFLRGKLARVLSLRRTPELRFRHDPSIALGSDTLSLIRELNEEREQREQAGGAPGDTDNATDERDRE
jgi:ribosome-binding factor A